MGRKSFPQGLNIHESRRKRKRKKAWFLFSRNPDGDNTSEARLLFPHPLIDCVVDSFKANHICSDQMRSVDQFSFTECYSGGDWGPIGARHVGRPGGLYGYMLVASNGETSSQGGRSCPFRCETVIPAWKGLLIPADIKHRIMSKYVVCCTSKLLVPTSHTSLHCGYLPYACGNL